jgi:transcriptional regulator with XRE-family HTH domain
LNHIAPKLSAVAPSETPSFGYAKIRHFSTLTGAAEHILDDDLDRGATVALHLKYLRVQSGMTLEDLAKDSGLTRSYLSKVERGISSPSIESALNIAKALGVTVDRLFGEQAQEDVVSIVRGNGKSAGDPNSYLSLVAGIKSDRAMRAFVVRPGKTQKRGRIMSHHEGEELLFVLTGTIEMQIGTRLETLQPGDCVQFDSTIAHRLTSLTDVPASALVVIAATA